LEIEAWPMERRISREDFNSLYSIFWKDGPKIKYKKPDSWINTQPEIFSDLPNWTTTKISKY